MSESSSPSTALRDRSAAAPRRSRPVALVIAAASLPMFMATLDNLVMTNALPVLHREMGASIEQLQWFVNAYTLAFAGAILVASALGDRFGRRTVFTVGIALFGAGSLFAALSSDPGQLIAARAVQGLGSAAVMPLSLALLTGAVPAARRALAIGIWGGVSGLGVAVGPLIGGAIMEGWNWQAIFWINIPVAVVAIPLAVLVLRNDFGARARIDVPGAVLAAGGVLALVHAIVRGNDDGWDSLGVIAELALGTALVLAFVVWQLRSKAPLVPLRLFRDRSFSITNVVGFAFSFGTFGSVFILIQYLQVVQGATPLEAAVQTTPWTIAPMFVAPLAGILASRVGTRILLMLGLLLQAVALAWMAIIITPTVAYVDLVVPFILAGVGMGLVFAPSATALLATLGLVDHAKASGVNSTVRELGVALGTAVMTAIFVGAGGQLLPDHYVDAARPAVFTGAAVLLVAAIAARWLPAGRGVHGATETPAAPESETSAPDPIAAESDPAEAVPAEADPAEAVALP
ncbi:DHA2 family efflux MFS transporter permease subunit [Microbacterium panaciterrae]|uniref:MFS transporter n=1 Tax=Microbacterium panaciterrae TaxID=985759 RepID=A0ABP8PF14_9MICO